MISRERILQLRRAGFADVVDHLIAPLLDHDRLEERANYWESKAHRAFAAAGNMPEARQAVAVICWCGKPQLLGKVHRVEIPCYYPTELVAPPGAET